MTTNDNCDEMFTCRAVVEQAFDKYSELDQILKFSTPKVLRLVEILRQVRPLNFVDPRKRRDKSENTDTLKGGTLIEGSECQIAEATSDPEHSEVAALHSVANEPRATSPGNSLKLCKDQDNNEEKEENSSEDSACLSRSTQNEQVKVSPTENCVNNIVESSKASGDISTKSSSEMLDLTVPKTDTKKSMCNGCVQEDSCLPSMRASTGQLEMSENMEAPHAGNCHDSCSSYVMKGCDEEQHRCSTPEAVSECHANGWSSQHDSLDLCDCKPSISISSGKSEREVSFEVESISCQHSLGEKCLHNGEVEDVCREPSKVQIHPDVTQNCCNISESVVTKEVGDGSTLEEDLCRLSLRESSLRVGCELENPTNCDVSNGTTSAKSHLHDAAKVHNNISALLCNGYQSGSEESLPSSRISEGSLDNKLNSHNSQEGPICSSQGKEEQCLEQSHSVQSNPCDAKIHSEEEVTPTSAHSTTSQPISEEANAPATPHKATTGSAETSEATSQSAQNNSSTISKDVDSTVSPAPAVSSEAAAMADTLALLLPGGGGGKGGRKRRDEVKEKVKVHNPEDPDSVCGLIFVHHRNMAKIIYRLLKVGTSPCFTNSVIHHLVYLPSYTCFDIYVGSQNT